MKKLLLSVLLLTAVTCKAAELKFASPTLLTNAINDALTNKAFAAGLVFATLTNLTLVNDATETTLIGAQTAGTTSIHSNFWTLGKTLEFNASGTYLATNTGITLKTTILGSSSSTATATITNLDAGGPKFWSANMFITCRSTGATGVLVMSGNFFFDGIRFPVISEPAIDTTKNTFVTFTGTWAAASVSNSITSKLIVVRANR